MQNKIIMLLGAVCVTTWAAPLLGKTIYFGNAAETVAVAYGAVTILRFEEPVKTISNASNFVIKPVNEESPDYGLLSVEPRVISGKYDAVFILAGGEIAKLRLSVVPKQARLKLDSVYDIKSQKSVIRSKTDSAPHVGRLELMAAMIRGDQVAGYDVTTPSIDLSTGSESTKVALKRVYSGEEFKGYVYEVRNSSRLKTFKLDVRRLQFGRPSQAILAYSDLDVLDRAGSGKDVSRLVVVAKPASGYRDAVLPIRMTRKEVKETQGGGDE